MVSRVQFSSSAVQSIIYCTIMHLTESLYWQPCHYWATLDSSFITSVWYIDGIGPFYM